MAYNLRGGNGLRKSRDSSLSDTADFDPMASVANVVDAMLVLCVGLLVALVAYWNLDMAEMQEILMDEEVTEVEEDIETMDQIAEGGTAYTELGTVYQDPATGKMYMLSEEDLTESAEGED